MPIPTTEAVVLGYWKGPNNLLPATAPLIVIILNKARREDKEIKNITMLNKVYNMPMFSDVFSKNENVTTFLDNLLKDIIPISQPTKTLLNINPFKLLNNNE